MSSHIDCTNALPNGSLLPSLRGPLTHTRATQIPHSESGELTPSQMISAQGKSQGRTFYKTTIDILPDEVFLDIFDHIRLSEHDSKSCHLPQVWKWHVLVCVCRRWRQLVLASPLRLILQLLCTNGTPVRKNLAFWPSFPIVVDYKGLTCKDYDDFIAALEQRSRICQITLRVSSSVWSKMATLMLEPFPALTSLSIISWPRNAPVPPVLPNKFLGGSAPSLRDLRLRGFPSLTLPIHFFHSTSLVHWQLDLIACNTNLIQTGCLLPERLVLCLARLPRLKSLSIRLPLCWTRTSHDDRREISLPSNTRIVLPVLTSFSFGGTCTYLEDLVAKIDAPALDSLNITFWDSRDYQIPQLSEFLTRTGLEPSLPRAAKLSFYGRDVAFIDLKYVTGLSIDIPLCKGRNHQVWCVAQVLRQTSTILSNVLCLEIEATPESHGDDGESHGEDNDSHSEEDDRYSEDDDSYSEDDESHGEGDGDMSNVDWSKLFFPFTAVREVYVYADSTFGEKITGAFEDTLAVSDRNSRPTFDIFPF